MLRDTTVTSSTAAPLTPAPEVGAWMGFSSWHSQKPTTQNQCLWHSPKARQTAVSPIHPWTRLVLPTQSCKIKTMHELYRSVLKSDVPIIYKESACLNSHCNSSPKPRNSSPCFDTDFTMIATKRYSEQNKNPPWNKQKTTWKLDWSCKMLL